MPQRLRLSEEGVELPELILLPLVERVVVALRALHLEPEEDLRGLGGGLDAVLVEFAREEIGSAVEPLLPRLVDAGGGDEIGDEPIVGDILGERTAQPLPHATPVDVVVFHAPTDEHGRPDISPIAGILVNGVIAEKPADEVGPLDRGTVGHEVFELPDRRDPADDIEMDPAAPFLIGRRFRRLELGVGPAGRHLLIDELHLRDAEVLVPFAGDSHGRGRGGQCSEDGQP